MVESRKATGDRRIRKSLGKNKKGDIPVTILVVGVFAVCSLAMLTFFIADFQMSNSFVGIKLMEEANSDIDEYYLYRADGKSFEDMSSVLNFTESEDGNYIEKTKSVKKFKGLSFEREEVVLFSVRYPVVP